jgi:two-component system, NtrC family, response regulator AtoC
LKSAFATSPPIVAERVIERVLVVDADEAQARQLTLMLGDLGHRVATAPHAAAARGELESRPYDLVVCDMLMLDAMLDTGPLVIASAIGEARARALDAMEAGAFDCLFKPCDPNHLAMALRRAEQYERLRRKTLDGQEAVPLEDAETVSGMVGTSAPMRDVFTMIDKVAHHKATVLLTGESGTGKELVARAIHDGSPRSRGRFVAINCGAIPANLLESELFGHKRGAFTDAVRDKAGLFEEASGGTLFLDEIGELPIELQPKILRAIQEEEIRRIGDNNTTKVNVRLIAATLRDLQLDVRMGRFREDLFYRLNVLPIRLPALRDRPEDIAPLVAHFIRRHRERHPGASSPDGVTPRAMRALEAYPWPGNIRELENALERAMVLCDKPLIDLELFDEKIRRPVSNDPIQQTLGTGELSIKKTTRLIEQELIRRALEATRGNRTNAAKLLEISHRALLYKIKEYGI